MEDFRDWTNWLLYRGGIGVKGEESWEAWWDEELVVLLRLDNCDDRYNSLFLFSSNLIYKIIAYCSSHANVIFNSLSFEIL